MNRKFAIETQCVFDTKNLWFVFKSLRKCVFLNKINQNNNKNGKIPQTITLTKINYL